MTYLDMHIADVLRGWEEWGGWCVCVQIALATDGWFDEEKQVILSTLPIPCAVTAIDTKL